MTITKLCSLLARLENTKSQARIQAIRSIIGHLSDILWSEFSIENFDSVDAIYTNGKRRAKKGKRK